MKFIDIKRNKYNFRLKCLGITVLNYSKDKNEYFKKYKLLYGLLYLKYDIFFDTFILRLCGFKFLSTHIFKNYKILKLFFFPIGIWDNATKQLNKVLDKIIDQNNYDEYYLFFCRSGEFFLLMHHFQEYLKKNQSNNYALVVFTKYHLNILNMFYPNIPVLYYKRIDVPLISKAVKNKFIIYRNKKIFIPFYEKYFNDVEKAIRYKKGHYYACLKEHLCLSDNVGQYYTISDTVKEKINKIVKYILNDNFIFISPETLSNEPMEKNFWINLVQNFKKNGYEIFCNSMCFENLIPDTQSMFLTYEEAIELSKYAKAIIGMRSGFLECLSQSNVPMHVLYTKFPKRNGFKEVPSHKVKSGFSITPLPNVNNNLLYEYDVNSYKKETEIIEEILKITRSILKGGING